MIRSSHLARWAVNSFALVRFNKLTAMDHLVPGRDLNSKSAVNCKVVATTCFSRKGTLSMRLQLRSVLALLSLAVLCHNSARAIDIVTPAGLNPGDTFRFIFVTTSTRDATSNSIADYNTFVSNDAAGYTYNNQAITWNVVGSTLIIDARDNVGGFNTSVPVYLVTGTKIADNLGTGTGGLWSGTPLAQINKTISGNTVASPTYTFTGTQSSGIKHSNVLGSISVLSGAITTNPQAWLEFGYLPKASSQRFYGISQPLTVAAVPEPSTYALAAIATGVMAALARRRKARQG